MINYLDPAKPQDHYGPEVQAKLIAFQDLWKSYFSMTWIDMRKDYIRLDAVQCAWDALVKARKAETGTGFYLTPEEYKNVNHS